MQPSARLPATCCLRAASCASTWAAREGRSKSMELPFDLLRLGWLTIRSLLPSPLWGPEGDESAIMLRARGQGKVCPTVDASAASEKGPSCAGLLPPGFTPA